MFDKPRNNYAMYDWPSDDEPQTRAELARRIDAAGDMRRRGWKGLAWNYLRVAQNEGRPTVRLP